MSEPEKFYETIGSTEEAKQREEEDRQKGLDERMARDAEGDWWDPRAAPLYVPIAMYPESQPNLLNATVATGPRSVSDEEESQGAWGSPEAAKAAKEAQAKAKQAAEKAKANKDKAAKEKKNGDKAKASDTSAPRVGQTEASSQIGQTSNKPTSQLKGT